MSSRYEHYVHFVWAVKYREPLLTPDIEREVHRLIVSEAQQLKCTVHAINGMPNHVHLVVSLHPDVCASRLMKQVKALSSAMVNDHHNHEKRFRWQDGYFVRSFARSGLATVTAYVVNQKQHHADGTLHAQWEDTGDEE